MHNSRMYIIAIGWLYVTILVAMNEPSVFAGIVSFAFYGLLPSSLLLWFSGTRVRRERRKYLESLADQRPDNGDRGDTQGNQ